MIWSDYWGALTSRQRAGLLAGVLLIAAAVIGLGVWLLHDPYVPIASSLNSEQLNGLMKELDRQKVPYRVGASADTVTVRSPRLARRVPPWKEGTWVYLPTWVWSCSRRLTSPLPTSRRK